MDKTLIVLLVDKNYLLQNLELYSDQLFVVGIQDNDAESIAISVNPKVFDSVTDLKVYNFSGISPKKIIHIVKRGESNTQKTFFAQPEIASNLPIVFKQES